MSAGFEARARITMDVSSYVAASRQAAAASATLTASVRSLRASLMQAQISARNAAASIAPLAAAQRAAAQAQQAATAAQRSATAATNQGAAGNRQNAQSMRTSEAALRTLGTRLSQTAQAQRQFAAVQREGNQLNQAQRTAARALSDEYARLMRQYGQLNSQQQASVNHHRQLADAQRRASETARANTTVLRTLANAMADNRAQARSLLQVQRQQGQLTQQQTQQLTQLRTALTQLRTQYMQLSQSQQATVQSMMRARTATQQTAQSFRQLGTSAQIAGGLIRGFGTASEQALANLWLLRSALNDVERGLSQMAQTAQRAVSALWETFSEQEMVIAHLGRVTQETQNNVDQLAEGVRQLAAEIPIAFAELGEIAVFGAQVGIANHQLLDFTETVALFAATTPVAADQAALLLARIQQMTTIDDTQIRNLGAAVSELGSNSAALEGEILRTIESIAVVSTQAGLSETSILGLGAAMASLRIRPELARGAMQRVMHQMGSAAQGASEQTEALANVLDMTREEVSNLQATDPDKFFFTLMEALGQTADSGDELVATIRELGIINTRDIDVVSRLAANYEVLDRAVAMSNRSFAEGTFLHREAERIFDTLTGRVQRLGNILGTFGARALEAVAPFLTVLLDTSIAVVSFLDSLGFVAPIVGFGAVLLGVVGIVAALSAVVARMGATYIALRTTIVQVGMALTGQSAATAASTAAMTANAAAAARKIILMQGLGAALARATTATVAATTSMTGLRAALAGVATSAVAGGAALGTGLAAGARAAGTALMTMVRAAAPLLAWTVIIGLVIELGRAFNELTMSTDRANQNLLDSAESAHQAAGGYDALEAAVLQDTFAMNEMATAAENSSDALALATFEVETADQSYREMGLSAEEAANELTFLETQAGMTAGQIHSLAEEAGNSDPELQALSQRVEGLQHTAEGAEGAIDGMTLAVGQATHEWARSAAEAHIMESGIMGAGEAFTMFNDVLRESGGLSGLVAVELMETGLAADHLRDEAENLREEMGFWPREGQEWASALSNVTFGLIDLTNETWHAADELDNLADVMDANGIVIESLSEGFDVMGDSLLVAADGTMHTREELAEMNPHMHAMEQQAVDAGDAARSFGVSVEDLATALGDFVQPVEAWNEAMEGTTGTSEAAGQALIDMQNNASEHFGSFITGMEDMQEAQIMWADNLLNLAGEVPPEVLAGLAEMGTEGAGIVAGLVDASADEVDRFVETWNAGGGIMLEDFSHTFSSFMRMAQDTGDTAGSDLVQDLLQQIRDGEISVQEAGEQSGTAFALGLLEQVQAGEIDFQTAVDEMTAYAQDEFDGADPTMTAHMEIVDAINDLNDLLTEALVAQGIIEESMTYEPSLDDENYRADMDDIVDFTGEGWERADESAEVRPRMLDEDYRRGLENLEENNSDKFNKMDEDSYTEPDLRDDDMNSGLDRLFGTNMSTFDFMKEDSWTEPDLQTGPWDGDLSSLFGTHGDRFRSMRGDSDVTPSLIGGPFIAGLNSLLGTARSIASQMQSALTVSASISRRGGSRSDHADGGWIGGHGGPRQDNHIINASSGEFMVRAARAQEFGPLLEAINSQRSLGLSDIMSPNFLPNDMAQIPRRPEPTSSMPRDLAQALRGSAQERGPKINITVNNQYPQAEPTSVTLNRALAYAGALDGVS